MKAAIVAASSNDVIGIDLNLPWHLPNDLKFFKEKTLGAAVVMGRRTYDSLLSYKWADDVLPGRTKYVVTNTLLEKRSNTFPIFVTDPATFIARLEAKYENVFVIGGSKIYTLFNELYDVIHLTRVDTTIESPSAIKLELNFSKYHRTLIDSRQADDRHNYNYSFETWIKS